MRVVSLVPSLTETLIAAGAEVVGRTRYCVHPEPQVRGIPVVGGTKDLNWEKLAAVSPDLLILDREENLPWMQQDSSVPVHVFHATGVSSMSEQLRGLAAPFSGAVRDSLLSFADRWERVARAPARVWDWSQIPGEQKRAGAVREWEQVLYLIWKKPWMSVSADTFIGSVFEKLGVGHRWPTFEKKYPEIELTDFSSEKTLLLLSSEPYPFGKKWDEMQSLPFTKVLVDGEMFSWFGLRSLEFLERALFSMGD